jgi:hypothetical protein
VRFEWDPAKSDANLRARGFDFAFAAQIFDSPTVEVEDRREDYGERRFVAIGLADGRYPTVVYTDRTDAAGEPVTWIISARRSTRRERTIYQETIP